MKVGFWLVSLSMALTHIGPWASAQIYRPYVPDIPGVRSMSFYLPAPGALAEVLSAHGVQFSLSSWCRSYLSPWRSSSRPKTIEMWVVDGLYAFSDIKSQIYGYRLLEAALAQNLQPHHRVLVLGSGVGFEAVVLAQRFGVHVDAIDIDPRAVRFTEINAERHGVSERVRSFQSDLFERVEGTYDLILFNAPRALLEDDYREWLSTPNPNENFIIGGNVTELKPPTYEQWIASFAKDDSKRAFADPGGKLLFRTLDQFPKFLSAKGRFLLMTTSHLPKYINTSQLTSRRVSEDPWELGNPSTKNQTFGIFELSLRPEPK
ncbi:MAG: methyltransferase [Bdellovibrionales bacterium]